MWNPRKLNAMQVPLVAYQKVPVNKDKDQLIAQAWAIREPFVPFGVQFNRRLDVLAWTTLRL